MSKDHMDIALCNFCSLGYRDRLQEMKKYIQQMFNNLSKNEILKQMYGSPELERLRLKKVEEIIRQALEGEKEEFIQSLMQKNVNLASQLGFQDGSKQKTEKADKARLECETLIGINNMQHEKEIDLLEDQYKNMLVSSIQEYQSEFKRLDDFYQLQLHEVKDKATRYEILHEQKQAHLSEAYRETNEKNHLIKQLERKLAEIKFGHMIVVSNQHKQSLERMQVLSKDNRQLKDMVLALKSQNQQLRAEYQLLIVQTRKTLEEGEEFILRTQVPQIMHDNEVQLYKLKQEYETEIFMCHKRYSTEIEVLKEQMGKMRAARCLRSASQDRIGKISHNKKEYGHMISEFGQKLGDIKRQFGQSRSILKKVRG